MRQGYVFNDEPLTNERPYFAGYLKIPDIPKFLDKLEAISDEWGYLLLWATLFLSLILGFILMLLPMVFGWRAFFQRRRGKLGVIVYFLCLGVGYMFVEIAMISKYILCLGNATPFGDHTGNGNAAVFRSGQLSFSPVRARGQAGHGRHLFRDNAAARSLCRLPRSYSGPGRTVALRLQDRHVA